MDGSVFGISKAEILAFFEKALKTIKDLFEKIGILVLPDEGEIPA